MCASHDVEKHCGLALRMTEFAGTKGGIPGALRFIEDDNVLIRSVLPFKVVAQEAHQWLDCTFSFLASLPRISSLVSGVSLQSSPHDEYEGQIAGQKRGVGIRSEYRVQTTKGLAGAGNSGHENHGVLPLRSGSRHNRNNCVGRCCQISDVSTSCLKVGDTVASVKQTSSINDRWHRTIR